MTVTCPTGENIIFPYAFVTNNGEAAIVEIDPNSTGTSVSVSALESSAASGNWRLTAGAFCADITP